MNNLGKHLAIWGIALQAGVVIGILGTVLCTVQIFTKLAQSNHVQPDDFVSSVRIAIYIGFLGAIPTLLGIIMILLALFDSMYRAPWFRTALQLVSILWLLAFPIGTFLGIFVLVYLRKHNAEFTELPETIYTHS